MILEKKEIQQSKILIVDDEPLNVEILEAILERSEYKNIYSTSDPRDVLSLQEKYGFDLILLDVNMPYLSGIEVLAKLSDHMSAGFLPVLILTANIDDETRYNALKLGATDFLTKPFNQWEVLLRINNMLRTRLFYKGQKIRADELEEKVRERTEKIKDTQLKIIQCLGKAVEFRDNETGAHVIRMSRSCQMLGLAAGLSEKHAEKILFASPMHDVGKIGIQDSILLKPGKLDFDEFEIMKTHAQIGSDIIGRGSSEILNLAGEIALGHHEQWDGSGYPHGHKGDAISIESRIAAICDVFDALTSARPYKDPWSSEDATSFIRDRAGAHFDPMLAAQFQAIIPEVIALREEYPDE
ncbi:MAG: HD domain-containing phosphohydrolase [Sneathiella sp.]